MKAKRSRLDPDLVVLRPAEETQPSQSRRTTLTNSGLRTTTTSRPRKRRLPPIALLGLALLASPGCAVRPFGKSPETRLREDVQGSIERDARPKADAAGTGSIWTPLATTILAGDTRAARAGDLVTVKIVESTKGSQEAKTDLSKDGKVSLATPALGGFEKRLAKRFTNFDPEKIMDTSTEKTFKGDGSTSRETSVLAFVTARVLGVYPNGDLAILGHKDVEVNHERQVLTIVGIVRAEDLDSSNTVGSDRIAELGVHLGGRGDINDQQREGWLSRLIQKVWPF